MRLTFGIVGLMILYLVLATGLALQYDRRFFFNDAVAAAIFVFLLIALRVMASDSSGRG